MPGPDCCEQLGKLHECLNPATYLEIGSRFGTTLGAARPPTVAVTVDPDPQLREPIQVGCHAYRETSTEFFTRRDVRALFGGKGPALVYMELHDFPTALADFARVEAISDPGTLVVLHNVIPFDEITQRPEPIYEFHTGDGWKLLHCLAEARPDLSWFTIRTPPSGLTFVTGLDAGSTVLRDQHEKLVERFDALRFEDSHGTPGSVLDNDWPLVADQLTHWSAASPTAQDAAPRRQPEIPIEHRDADALARRVRDLEATNAGVRHELVEAKRTATHDGALIWMTDPESAYAELQRLRNTKLYRWTRPLRKAYARLRRHGDVV
jgi:hypothetical protein